MLNEQGASISDPGPSQSFLEDVVLGAPESPKGAARHHRVDDEVGVQVR